MISSDPHHDAAICTLAFKLATTAADVLAAEQAGSPPAVTEPVRCALVVLAGAAEPVLVALGCENTERLTNQAKAATSQAFAHWRLDRSHPKFYEGVGLAAQELLRHWGAMTP